MLFVLLHISDMQQIKQHFLSTKWLITLAFFDRNLRCTLLLRPCPQERSTAGAAQRPKSSIACLTGYLGSILCEWLLIAPGEYTPQHTRHTTVAQLNLNLNPAIPRMP